MEIIKYQALMALFEVFNDIEKYLFVKCVTNWREKETHNK